MPFNDNSAQNQVKFLSVIGEMQGLIDIYYSLNFIFGGNCNISKSSVSNICNSLSNFCDRNALLWLDPVINSVNYTYHVDCLGSFSLIDYFTCSPKLTDDNVRNQILDPGKYTSDHLAIMCNFTYVT